MKNCLSQETIELLSDRNLRGARFVEALKHLETCADCRARVRMPTKEEILRRLEPDPKEENPPSTSSSTKAESPDAPADKEKDEAFQKLLDRIRGSRKTEFRKIKERAVFQLFPFFPHLRLLPGF